MTNLLRVLFYLGGAMRRLDWDIEHIKSFQKKRLRSVIDNAYQHSKFYHTLFKENNLLPTDIKSQEDLQKIPVVDKSVYKNIPADDLLSDEYDKNKLKIVKTSGSSGSPFKIFISPKENDWRKAIYMRANISCGQMPLDRWIVITAPHHFSDTTNIQRRLRIFSQSCVSVFDEIDKQVETIKNLQPDIIDGYSGPILLIAKKIEIGEINPKIIFGSAELIDEESRKIIEKSFSAPYFDQFGCAEIDRSAWQCPERTGYHMDIDSVITQFVDGQGASTAPGENGDIVYTSLFNYAMPIIRYNIGDVGSESTDECNCNRGLPLMSVVEGRSDNFIPLPDGRFLSPRVFTNTMSLYKNYHDIVQFMIIQQSLSQIDILIQKKLDSTISEGVMEGDLITHFRKILSLKEDVTLSIIFETNIPIEHNGKHKSVISKLSRRV